MREDAAEFALFSHRLGKNEQFRDEALDEQAEIRSLLPFSSLPVSREETFYKFLLTAVQRQDDTVIRKYSGRDSSSVAANTDSR